MNIKDELEKFREGLLQQRDELKLQINLAKMEAKEEWESTESKIDSFLAKLEAAGSEAKEASSDVLESAKALGEEIKSAYERIRKQL
jgi:hypothetical protein